MGVVLAVKQRRNYVKLQAESLLGLTGSEELKAAINAWLESFEDRHRTTATPDVLIAAVGKGRIEAVRSQ